MPKAYSNYRSAIKQNVIIVRRCSAKKKKRPLVFTNGL
ncbi:hypothetical protein predicted by Glimmer/Critica [Bdellovibrio bacteriovorus HD100]|uniref:Uncharacterized protein n=1 Tax=Bdellovibrio bacteriovorus (strain ATCC 15356 / DSM 50701 / NCIMB 9529 / HD100) TaxID=264462 RepID=Q6MJ52_BDEBA|nr:hypothetical protein predicted by Glimmer/Critica [Bdellovibrio bacteriovorus HD100]